MLWSINYEMKGCVSPPGRGLKIPEGVFQSVFPTAIVPCNAPDVVLPLFWAMEGGVEKNGDPSQLNMFMKHQQETNLYWGCLVFVATTQIRLF